MAEHDEAAPDRGGAPVSDRLQALLSRAAREQLDEQRQLAAVLAELRTTVDGLDERLRATTAGERRDLAAVDVASLADVLAPRVADLLAERLSATLVEQLAERVTASVREELGERVREGEDDLERRIAGHVDEAVLALAEVLLRPRRGRRAAGTAAATDGTSKP